MGVAFISVVKRAVNESSLTTKLIWTSSMFVNCRMFSIITISVQHFFCACSCTKVLLVGTNVAVFLFLFPTGYKRFDLI